MNNVTCYMCDKIATTKEHTPPKSWFPQNMRNQLLTVPSCPEHNNENNEDAEYLRVYISSYCVNNKIGIDLFNLKATKSLNHSKGLKSIVSFGAHKVNYQNGQTTALLLDVKRFERFFNCMFKALYFKLTEKKYLQNWKVIPEDIFMNNDAIIESYNPGLSNYRILLENKFTLLPTSNPKVFSYAMFGQNNIVAIKAEFYEGFKVYGIGENN